jgi:hypothetical protein
MSTKSWLGVGAGAVIALALPIATWIVGLSLPGVAFTADQVRLRDLAVEQARPLTDLLTTFSLAELILGPLGVFIVGRSAGLHGATRWLVLVVVTVPLLAIVWLLGLLTMFGAVGKPL